MKCMWCEENSAIPASQTGYWELPDGSRAIQITDIPSIECLGCKMKYQEDQIIEEIEDQLMLIKTSELPSTLSYVQLMSIPRLLKKNYFKMG